jgi:putative ABC transport system ATP-binding protein
MVSLVNVSKTYRTRSGEVKALSEVNLQVGKGEFVVVCGPSGSGKTTLLMTIAAMLRPTAGSVIVNQSDIYKMSMRNRTLFRAGNIGFVFQMFHLIPYLNVIENVTLAGRVLCKSRPPDVMELLRQLGLAERAFHKPGELSAGEKQRTAIARALINQPKIILADEPTGNLDPLNAGIVLRHLSDFNRAGGTVIVATHGPVAHEFATKVVSLRNGWIEGVN